MQSPGSRTMLGDFLMEMVSTFAFTIIAGLTYGQAILIPAIAIGLGCAVLVSSERTHMNPVISIAVALVDEYLGWPELVLRVLAQVIGCLLGGIAAVDGLRNEVLSFSEKSGKAIAKLFVFEMVFACVLVLVVLRTREIPTGAFAHGLTYTIAILCGYLLFEGAALINPIVAVGLLVGSSSFDDGATDESDIWVYLIAPFIGCLLAVLFYMLTEYLLGDDDDKDDVEYEETTEWVKSTQVKKVETRNSGYDDEETTEFVRGDQYVNKPRPVVNGANYNGASYNGANYQRPQSQPGNGNYQQPNGRGSYQQPGAQFSPPRNQQAALRQRRVASNPSTVNSQQNTPGYVQPSGYRPQRYNQPPSAAGNKYVQNR